ncbi:MAG: hypothetical protein AUH16_01050 [Acidobacteria bacterium 13_2_20CM_57_7]|nr:MAG: hypothetical protein AUH16_01050 [Acidobacteria bacterium 13_2_20CM_57_7]
MKNVGRVFLTTVAGLTLVVAVWAFSPPSTQEAALLNLSSTSNVPQEQSQTQNLQQDPATAKTMTFLIDKNTTIDGSLKVGANADVTYRQEKGSNVAISVRVTP